VLELLNLLNSVLRGEPIPEGLQQQLDAVTDRFAEQVAANVAGRLNTPQQEEIEDGLSDSTTQPK